jgi:hypothetical protein
MLQYGIMFPLSSALVIMLSSMTLLGGTSCAKPAQSMDPRYYDIGSPTVTDVWVDPTGGDDSRSGTSRAQALRTVTAAWNRIPMGTTLATTGYRIMLVAGAYPESSLPNYWESRYGTYQFPIIIQAADGRGSATLQGDLNIFDTRYLYLIDFNIVPQPPGDAFHCERCDHVLLRGMTLDGGRNREAHETVKANQSQYLYIEDSDISGADDNAVDFVAVRSTDHGDSWMPAGNGLTNLVISFAFSHSGPIYAGTRMQGVFRATDPTAP